MLSFLFNHKNHCYDDQAKVNKRYWKVLCYTKSVCDFSTTCVIMFISSRLTIIICSRQRRGYAIIPINQVLTFQNEMISTTFIHLLEQCTKWLL